MSFVEKLAPTLDKRCGTYPGYKAHRQRNEQLCQPCRDAMNAYRREKWKTDPEKYRAHGKTYKQRHPERVKEFQKKYAKHVPPEIKAARKAARAAITNSPERVEARKAKAREVGKKYRLENKEKVALRAKEYAKKNRDRLREKDRQRRAADPERYKKQSREYYLKNKDKLIESKKEWLRKNPHHKSEVDRRRRARRANNGYERYTTEQVLELFGKECYICDEPIDLTAERQAGKKGWERGLHIDHVVPISKGGPDTLANVRPVHAQCNLRKQATFSLSAKA